VTKLTFNISSTALGNAGCILRFYRTVAEGYKEKSFPSRMIYGIAGHKFIEKMYKTNNVKLAIDEAKRVFNAIPRNDDKKSPHLSDERHLTATCLNLWTQFVLQESSFNLIMLGDKPATEVTFNIPYYEDDYVIVNLCGTIDKVGQFQGGCFAIGDWKFTSSWDNKGYFTQYELSRQLRFYTLACKLMAIKEPESILGRIGATKMGAFIDGVFLKPNPNEGGVKRSDVYQYSEDSIHRFQGTLNDFIQRLSLAVRSIRYPKEGILNGSCEGKWGKCPFWSACKAPDNIAELILKQHFNKLTYNPLDYNNLEAIDL